MYVYFFTNPASSPFKVINLIHSTANVNFSTEWGRWGDSGRLRRLISAYGTLQTLHFLALTETWITPDNTATPAALSAAYSLTLQDPRARSGSGLLISPKWSYWVYPLHHLTISSFKFHAVSVTIPIKLNIAVIYCPPGPLGHPGCNTHLRMSGRHQHMEDCASPEAQPSSS